MPFTYIRNDGRRLLVIEPAAPDIDLTLEDFYGVIDRQKSENIWDYAVLYDLRRARFIGDSSFVQLVSEYVRRVGDGVPRGPVAAAVAPDPARVRLGIEYARVSRDVQEFELLVTESQVTAWLVRHAKGYGHTT